jgi:hypothetical protein
MYVSVRFTHDCPPLIKPICSCAECVCPHKIIMRLFLTNKAFIWESLKCNSLQVNLCRAQRARACVPVLRSCLPYFLLVTSIRSDVYLLAPVSWVGSCVRCSLGNFLKRFYTSLSRVFLFLFYSSFLLPLTVNSKHPLCHPPSFSLHLCRLTHTHLQCRQHVQHATAAFPCAFAFTFTFTLPRLTLPSHIANAMSIGTEVGLHLMSC